MKVGWQLATKKDDLWVKVIKAKYRCGNDLVPRISRDKAGSNLWRGLCHSWSMVESNIVWRMGDGASINCWKDNWLHSVGTLEDSLQHALRWWRMRCGSKILLMRMGIGLLMVYLGWSRMILSS